MSDLSREVIIRFKDGDGELIIPFTSTQKLNKFIDILIDTTEPIDASCDDGSLTINRDNMLAFYSNMHPVPELVFYHIVIKYAHTTVEVGLNLSSAKANEVYSDISSLLQEQMYGMHIFYQMSNRQAGVMISSDIQYVNIVRVRE